MAKYKVSLREIVTYVVTVEADDEDAAGELAAETWAESEDPTQDFGGQGWGVDVQLVQQI